MLSWPALSVESTPAASFRPPHCPWRACPSHLPARRAPFRFRRHGSFTRLCDRRPVRRFRCLCCRRTFSTQSFAFSYYLKRPELSAPIAAGLVAGSAHRQLARSLRCAPTSVTLQAQRLGRHCLLLHSEAFSCLEPLSERLVYDDFESFVLSQDLPFGLGTAVGAETDFLYSLDQAPHRPGAAKSRKRLERLARRPRPPRGAYRREFARLLALLLPKLRGGELLRLATDAHAAYRACVKAHPQRGRIEHRAYRNPPRRRTEEARSAEAIARDVALRPVDALHRLMRHSNAHHRRETIAFARRLEDAVGRGFVMGVFRNFVKKRRENGEETASPAMKLGLAKERWTWGRVLSKRLFRWRTWLPEGWARIYERTLRWPEPRRMKPLALVNAG